MSANGAQPPQRSCFRFKTMLSTGALSCAELIVASERDSPKTKCAVCTFTESEWCASLTRSSAAKGSYKSAHAVSTINSPFVSCSVGLCGRRSGRVAITSSTDGDGCWTAARVGRRKLRRDTKRVDRTIDRPVLVPVVAATFQAEIGPADRGAIQVTTDDLAPR